MRRDPPTVTVTGVAYLSLYLTYDPTVLLTYHTTQHVVFVSPLLRLWTARCETGDRRVPVQSDPTVSLLRFLRAVPDLLPGPDTGTLKS